MANATSLELVWKFRSGCRKVNKNPIKSEFQSCALVRKSHERKCNINFCFDPYLGRRLASITFGCVKNLLLRSIGCVLGR